MAQLEAELFELLGRWRSEGRCVVFTNGVFDLLHPGHIEQLRAARAFGDALIVGLNSDSSVRRQGKGDDRPILPEAARRAVLSELRCVDAVAFFDEDTPQELIELIEPDVLVKGADYNGQQIAGADSVEARGGRVELIPLVPGWSTTAIIRRIREGQAGA